MLRSELATAVVVRPASLVAGELRVPGDKSIAHRALILGSLAEGESLVQGIPEGEDVRATIACLRSLGVQISPSPSQVGRGYRVTPSRLATPHGELDCANSGTTMRLLLGLLAGSRVSATLDGDQSLRRRPMGRVIEPLRLMGARIDSVDGHAPLTVAGSRLQGRRHIPAIASAQVKGAILIAGLSASGPTTIVEQQATRDHTERLMAVMGADVAGRGNTIELRPSHRSLRPLHLTIPGDFSSAAFWMAAAAMRPGWSITIRGVGLNPSRIAFARLLEEMGAEVQIDVSIESPEPWGSLRVVGGGLKAIDVGPDRVAATIDEIPALLSLATQAEGVTTIRGAGELRFKESDRLSAMATGLARMGARVEEGTDGISVHGGVPLQGATVDSGGDHRIAMALAIAAVVASSATTIEGADSVAVSYPEFFQHLREVTDGR